MKGKFCLMEFRILEPKRVLEMLVKKTKVYVRTKRGVVNPYVPLFNILMEKSRWTRLSLFMKLMNVIGEPVPVPASLSEEYANMMVYMVTRMAKNSFIEYTKKRVSESQLPKEDREMIEEYYTVKKRIWKPLVKRGDLVGEGSDIIVRGRYAHYLLQRRSDIIRGMTSRMGFLRLIERLIVPRKWSVESLSRDMYGEEWKKYTRRVAIMMSILREYKMIKFSMRRGTWVLNLTREELIRLLEALHLKRERIAERIMSRLLYVLLRENGKTHYQAMREVYPNWTGTCSEGWWMERVLPLKISPVYVRELVERGYLSEYEMGLAKEYGIVK